MQITRKVAPGQKGVKRLLDQYGAKLICVRYRCDDQKRKRFKPIELIIEESLWSPPERIFGETMAGICVAFKEIELQRRVKQAGGKWNPAKRVWEIHYDQAVALGLNKRIVKLEVSDIRHHRQRDNCSQADRRKAHGPMWFRG